MKTAFEYFLPSRRKTQGFLALSFAWLILACLVLPVSAQGNGADEPGVAQASPEGKSAAARLLIAKGDGGKGAAKAGGGATTITWQTNYQKTLNMAKASRKWVLVDVFTDWCHWCKRLDKDVYAHPKIAQFLNKSFVCMKANAERGDGVQIKNQFGIAGYPCTLILEPSGKEKGRIDGYLPPAQFPLEVTRLLQNQ